MGLEVAPPEDQTQVPHDGSPRVLPGTVLRVRPSNVNGFIQITDAEQPQLPVFVLPSQTNLRFEASRLARNGESEGNRLQDPLAETGIHPLECGRAPLDFLAWSCRAAHSRSPRPKLGGLFFVSADLRIPPRSTEISTRGSNY